MPIDPMHKEKVVDNCRGHKKEFHTSGANLRIFAKLTPDELYDMLQERTRGAAKSAAKRLLEKMTDKTWSIIAAVHAGDAADADPFLHITLRIDNGYHLICHVRSGALYIYSISGTKPKELG